MPDGPLDPRLPRRSEPAEPGLEPALGGPGRELLVRFAPLLSRMPPVRTDNLPPERILFNFLCAVLAREVVHGRNVEIALDQMVGFLRERLPDDVVEAIGDPLRKCWMEEDGHAHAVRHALDLLHHCPVGHPRSADIHRLLAETAGVRRPANDHGDCLRAVLSAVKLREAGADDGALLRRALEVVPEYLPLLLRIEEPEPAEWTVITAMCGGYGAKSLHDIADVLARWYRNCPPGPPADAGLRVPYKILGEVPLVPGLPLLRIAVERLCGSARWLSGFYDPARPLVQVVRRAVWIDGESASDIRAFLRDLLAGPGGACTRRQALMRLALLNPLFSAHIEVVLDMPGLGELCESVRNQESAGAGDQGGRLTDLLPAQWLRSAGVGRRSPAVPTDRVRIEPALRAAVAAEYAALRPETEAQRIREFFSSRPE